MTELKLSELEEHYQSVTFGYVEPTHLRLSVDMHREYIRLVQMVGSRLGWSKELIRLSEVWFNNCDVTVAVDMAGPMAHFANVNRLNDPRYNCWRDTEGTWHQGSNYPSWQNAPVMGAHK